MKRFSLFLVHFIHRYMLYNQKRNWGFYFGHIFFDNDISSAEKNLYIWQMLCNFTRKHHKSSFFYENRTAHNVVSILISWSYWLLGNFFLQKNSLLNFLKEGLFEVLYIKAAFAKKKLQERNYGKHPQDLLIPSIFYTVHKYFLLKES